MEHLNSENVLAIVRVSNDNTFWLRHEVKVGPEWKTPGLTDNCIVITLQDRPFTSAGVVFGTSEDCEVVIAKKEKAERTSLSRTFYECHFSIGLDHQYRLVARDLTGDQGIQVQYNAAKNKPDDHNAEWILAGRDVPDIYRKLDATPGQLDRWRLTIYVEDQPTFDILPGKAIQSLQGLQEPNMQAQLFRQGKYPDGLLSQQVPAIVPRYFPEKGLIERGIGEGGFGAVVHYWSPFTGKQHVVKKPLTRRMSLERWEKEARVMDLARHPHIVEFLGADFDTTPHIAMEHVALGALRAHKDITGVEALIILRQCTSALSFLHAHEPAIVHRDIKPHNILVQQRGEGGVNDHIVVKLCDFGLAREIPRGQIDSHPGTLNYAPPEYYPVGNYQPPLGVKIDIWCLGLVVFELVSQILLGSGSTHHQLGDGDIIVGKPMHDRIVKDLHRFAESHRQGDFDILKRMLVLDPVGRITAKEAHELAERMNISAFVTTTAMEPGTAVSQAQPLDYQADIAAEVLRSLSISNPRLAKRKRGQVI
ncbi:unnamed protein product [Clonostachys byssicola]|uniref:Protein kinase domain-containing protein n=1 Tax=Clonostachys byssicola TaxID=160290 RepID=A0A9N9UVH1_9HYPO|nr:unnamed protein product [Clonostachys byssicola]